MSAYSIVDLDIRDREGYAKYPPQVIPQIEKHEGRILHRISSFETLEGEWRPKRLVIIEFPSKDHIRRFYEAEEYQPLKALRLKTVSSQLAIGEEDPPA